MQTTGDQAAPATATASTQPVTLPMPAHRSDPSAADPPLPAATPASASIPSSAADPVTRPRAWVFIGYGYLLMVIHGLALVGALFSLVKGALVPAVIGGVVNVIMLRLGISIARQQRVGWFGLIIMAIVGGSVLTILSVAERGGIGPLPWAIFVGLYLPPIVSGLWNYRHLQS